MRKLKATTEASHHHSVYVVLLDEAARPRRRRKNASKTEAEPQKPCVYVGMSGLDPEERFANHKRGYKASRVVRDHGLRLLPELSEHLNPMPYEAAARMEEDLAADLKAEGYCVFGGH